MKCTFFVVFIVLRLYHKTESTNVPIWRAGVQQLSYPYCIYSSFWDASCTQGGSREKLAAHLTFLSCINDIDCLTDPLYFPNTILRILHDFPNFLEHYENVMTLWYAEVMTPRLKTRSDYRKAIHTFKLSLCISVLFEPTYKTCSAECFLPDDTCEVYRSHLILMSCLQDADCFDNRNSLFQILTEFVTENRNLLAVYGVSLRPPQVLSKKFEPKNGA
jgi:hypothetical protein